MFLFRKLFNFKTIKEELINDIKFIMKHELLFSFLFISFAAAIYLVKPPPPNNIIMLTGQSGMAYSQYAEKYKKYFSDNGFTLHLISTSGSVENVKRLNDPNDASQVAFVQGGTVEIEDAKNISTLGSLFYEPVWLFYRGTKQPETSSKLREIFGRNINIGAPNSGTNALAQNLMKLNKLDNLPNLIRLPTNEAIQKLNKKAIDGVFLVDTTSSENVRELIKNDELNLLSFSRADAYSYAVDYLEN